MTARMSVITDWRVKDESALPDLALGDEYERVITPQKFVVLHRVIVRGPWLSLVSLRIGAVPDVPFELERSEGEEHDYGAEIRSYRPKVDDASIRQQLASTGAAAAGTSTIALVPGIDVRLVLRNGSVYPTKPRAALLVQEENP